MTKTQNYNLNKPEVTDPLRLEDFNENADILDGLLNSLNTAVGSKAEQSAVEALNTALAGKGNCRIATGSYVGDGKYGSASPNSLTFEFQPQVIWFVTEASCQYDTGVFIRPTTASRGLDGRNIILSWSGNSVSWYCGISDGYDHSAAQNNTLNTAYYWIAIGVA